MFVSILIRQRFLPRWFRWADVNPRHWRWTLVSNWNRKLWIKGLLLHFRLIFCFCFSLKNWIVKVSPCLMIWGQFKKHFVKWYRVRHGFRLAKNDDYFWVDWAVFLEAAGAVLRFGSSLKPNHQQVI